MTKDAASLPAIDAIRLLGGTRKSHEQLREKVRLIGYAVMTGDIEVRDKNQVIDSVDTLLNGPISDIDKGLNDILDACADRKS